MGLFKNKGKGLDKVLKLATKVTSGLPLVGAVVSTVEKLVPDEGFGSGTGVIGTGALKGLFKGGKNDSSSSTTNSQNTTQSNYKAGPTPDGTVTPTAVDWKSFSAWPMWAKIGVFALPGGLILLLLMGGKKSKYGRR